MLNYNSTSHICVFHAFWLLTTLCLSFEVMFSLCCIDEKPQRQLWIWFAYFSPMFMNIEASCFLDNQNGHHLLVLCLVSVPLDICSVYHCLIMAFHQTLSSLH